MNETIEYQQWNDKMLDRGANMFFVGSSKLVQAYMAGKCIGVFNLNDNKEIEVM